MNQPVAQSERADRGKFELAAIDGREMRDGLERAAIATISEGRRRLATNQLEVLYAAALSGSGIALLPRFLVDDDLEAGSLIALLTETPPLDGAVQAVWPDSRFMPLKTRWFIDFLASRLSQPAIWRRPIHPATRAADSRTCACPASDADSPVGHRQNFLGTETMGAETMGAGLP